MTGTYELTDEQIHLITRCLRHRSTALDDTLDDLASDYHEDEAQYMERLRKEEQECMELIGALWNQQSKTKGTS